MSQIVMIAFASTFFLFDEPQKELKKVNLDVPFFTSILTCYCATFLGGTLCPILCSFSNSRIRWMIFFYSMTGAISSIIFGLSLATSATMIAQSLDGKNIYKYVFWIGGVVAIIAGFLGGYLASVVLNWKLSKFHKNNVNAK